MYMYMYMYTYTYTYMYMYMYVHVYVYVCRYTYPYIICIYAYVRQVKLEAGARIRTILLAVVCGSVKRDLFIWQKRPINIAYATGQNGGGGAHPHHPPCGSMR